MTMNGTNGSCGAMRICLDQWKQTNQDEHVKPWNETQFNQWSLIMEQEQVGLEWILTKQMKIHIGW